jgi:hypothetical protein
MLSEGYTTIFHPGNKGVTIHEPYTLNITMNKPPVLQGHNEEGQKLWTIATSEEEDEINNVTTYHQQKKHKILSCSRRIPG